MALWNGKPIKQNADYVSVEKDGSALLDSNFGRQICGPGYAQTRWRWGPCLVAVSSKMWLVPELTSKRTARYHLHDSRQIPNHPIENDLCGEGDDKDSRYVVGMLSAWSLVWSSSYLILGVVRRCQDLSGTKREGELV
ncbi:hypothetical protein MUK42_23867 [Musa troglodytarum]|uniref:Uncharacterized protein n=1 Tax=Musa troglodytarum TaxID=320322 RepID=A0A9E7ENP4_9LILI|nr:hypothetical protein MUK42_23867 [Musa troglodytarum]